MNQLSCTTVEWRGLTLASDRSSPFGIQSLAGWDELPDSRQESPVRPQAHGRFDTPVWADERVVTLQGQIVSQDRDALLAELSGVMGWPSGGGAAETLTVTRAGRTLTASARLRAFRTPTDLNWSVGQVPFAIEWRCADPLRYGTAATLETGFPVLAGGLEFDLFTDGTTDTGFLEFGSASSNGRVVTSNAGNADAWPQFTITGPVPAFQIVAVESGRRLVFSRPVNAGDSLVIDTATGVVLLNGGDVDYSGYLTTAEWAPVPAGGSQTFAFLPVSGTGDGTMAVTWRPAFW